MKTAQRYTTMTTEQITSDMYDKITAITVTQGRLLPASLIYGDGTKFGCNRKLFDTVYNEVKRVLPSHAL